MILIGVIGSAQEDEELNKLAYDVGRAIAKKGAVLVCGGLSGIMHHACRGAKDAGGLTVGILPTGSKKDANPYVDIPIATEMGKARNTIIAKASDVLVAIGGSYGTLSEIAHSLNFGKKVFSLKSWEVLTSQNNFIVVDNPDKAVERAFKEAQKSEKGE